MQQSVSIPCYVCVLGTLKIWWLDLLAIFSLIFRRVKLFYLCWIFRQFTVVYITEHEISTEKCFDICWYKIKFALAFAEWLTLVENVYCILAPTFARLNWNVYRSTPKVLRKCQMSDCYFMLCIAVKVLQNWYSCDMLYTCDLPTMPFFDSPVSGIHIRYICHAISNKLPSSFLVFYGLMYTQSWG